MFSSLNNFAVSLRKQNVPYSTAASARQRGGANLLLHPEPFSNTQKTK
jgi:hypothetical protein